MTLVAKNPPPKVEEKKGAPGAKVLQVTQTTPPKKEEVVEELKPLEDRMHRINQLWQLQGKHQRLKESQNRLKKFMAEVEKENLQVTIKSSDYGSREEFTTKNIVVIEEVLTCLIATTDAKIKELEPQLVW